jgi:hypothetical protein
VRRRELEPPFGISKKEVVMYKSRCAVRGCTEHPMWEIVWLNGQLYDVCDNHARLQETSRYDAGPEGSLLPIDAAHEPASTEPRHRGRRAQSSL